LAVFTRLGAGAEKGALLQRRGLGRAGSEGKTDFFLGREGALGILAGGKRLGRGLKFSMGARDDLSSWGRREKEGPHAGGGRGVGGGGV